MTNPLQHELFDLITLMPDVQVDELLAYVATLRQARARSTRSNMSAQFCGCDYEAGYTCERHLTEDRHIWEGSMDRPYRETDAESMSEDLRRRQAQVNAESDKCKTMGGGMGVGASNAAYATAREMNARELIARRINALNDEITDLTVLASALPLELPYRAEQALRNMLRTLERAGRF